MSGVTLAFLQELIKLYEPDVMVTSFQEAAGCARGDNYTAMLYRIKLEGFQEKYANIREEWNKSIMYKCLPQSFVRREAFKSNTLFKNEIAFYTRVLPALINYQNMKSVQLKQIFRAIPQCYFARSDILVLEDLCTRGMSMVDRKLNFNYQQCSAVLKELSKFHALSLAFKVEKPKEFKALLGDKNGVQECLFREEYQDWYRQYYSVATSNAVDMVRQALATNPSHGTYIRKFTEFANESFYSRMISLVQPVEPLAVFCHGDCWTNNILFDISENGERINEVCFVDFQMCRYGSLALDLVYLLYCCTDRHMRNSTLELLLSEYHESMYEQLHDLLGSEMQTLCPFMEKEQLYKMIKSEFAKYSLFGLGSAIEMIPIITCDSEQVPDLYVRAENSDETVLHPIKITPVWTANESCKQRLANLVCELVDEGIL